MAKIVHWCLATFWICLILKIENVLRKHWMHFAGITGEDSETQRSKLIYSVWDRWMDKRTHNSSFAFFFFFYWLIIGLQYWFDACHTSTRIIHRYTYAPSLLNLFQPHTHSHCSRPSQSPSLSSLELRILMSILQCWHCLVKNVISL